jgi:hypothetical protein
VGTSRGPHTVRTTAERGEKATAGLLRSVGRQAAALAAAVGIATALAAVDIFVVVIIVIVIVLGLNIHNYYSILNKTYFILKQTNFLSNEP